jgi:glycosyltransferase involved in cell wall biosynthesis
MRLFQNSSIYPGYEPRLRALAPASLPFDEQVRCFLADRYAASHFLKPVLDGDANAFFTNGSDAALQNTWAREQGLPADTSAADILLAQIEHHRTEVFYNLDPVRFDDAFVARLPGCVKKRIAWRAAPSPHQNFRSYDLLVSNFPGILARYAEQGFRTAPFHPAHDDAMNTYAACTDRPVDILFVGGYSRHHRRRAVILEAVARLAGRWRVRFCLDRSRLTKLAESPLGLLPPLAQHRRPAAIRRVAGKGVFGLDLYEALSQAKIALNAAVDMAGEERGNMRCFEAMGCGSLLLSDEGRYPHGMEPGRTLVTFRDADDAVRQAEALLQGPAELRERIARAGHEAIAYEYSRERQWQAFLALCA